MTIHCKKCKTDKPADQMKIRAGKPSKVCLDCDAAAAAERDRLRKVVADAKAEQSRRRRRRAPAKRSAAVDEADDMRLTVPGGGLGFDAFLTEDDRLQIKQENDDGTADNIVITKREFRAIADRFGGWAGE